MTTRSQEDATQLRRQVEELRRTIQRTQRLIDVLDFVRHASRCVVDQEGCGELPRLVCDRLEEPGGYADALVSLVEESSAAEPAAEVDEAGTFAAPIEHDGKEYGRLLVSTAPGPDPDSNERALLSQIAADMGLVLHNLARPRSRKREGTRPRAEDAIFRGCFDGVSIGLALFRGHDKPLLVNRAFADLLGYAREELEQLPTTEAMKRISCPEDYEREMPLLHDLMNRRRSSYAIEKRFLRKSGDIVPGLCTTTFFFDDEGEFRFGVTSVQDISEHVGTREELSRTYEGAIDALTAALESRDPYTAGHQRRVTQLACAIADSMGLTGQQRMGLKVASILHDIGKIAIPAEILTKPYSVSETEYSLIRSHPVIAYDILKEIRFPWPVADIVVQHHERLDGSGYPAGLKRERILLEARILAVADTVEALASHRPYRAAFAIDDVMRHIVERRSITFDPDAVDACRRVFAGGFRFEEQGYRRPGEHPLD